MKRFVYADNAATTRISPQVLDAMMPWLTDGYGNASSIYSKGREARIAMEEARHKIERALGVPESRPDFPVEVYFTSGGSEADNWAIKGVAHLMAQQGKNILLPPYLSTTRFSTPVRRWKKKDLTSPTCRSATKG